MLQMTMLLALNGRKILGGLGEVISLRWFSTSISKMTWLLEALD